MDTTSTYDDFSTPSINLGIPSKPFNFFVLVLLIIVIFILIVPWNKIPNHDNKEGMSGGTLTQLFAQDSQDVYLKSNVNKIATGNFNLMFNDPTRITASFQNRGSPLDSIYLPDTSMNPNPYALEVSNKYADNITNTRAKKIPNPILSIDWDSNSNSNSKLILPFDSTSNKPIPNNVLPSTLQFKDLDHNPYELAFVGEQISKTKTDADNLPQMTSWTKSDYLFQDYYNKLLYNKDCIKDPGACGGGAGGFRLGEDFNQATKAKPYVTISGNTFYPDSYVGSYFIEPPFDISKPYPFMPNSNLPPMFKIKS